MRFSIMVEAMPDIDGLSCGYCKGLVDLGEAYGLHCNFFDDDCEIKSGGGGLRCKKCLDANAHGNDEHVSPPCQASGCDEPRFPGSLFCFQHGGVHPIKDSTKLNCGQKFDGGKLCYDLLPPDALEGVVQVLTYGASKYKDRNWELGINYGRVFGAVMRHLWAWWRGQENDPESGLPHLDHAMCGVLFLSAFTKRQRLEHDDRPHKFHQESVKA